jgi:hypothetical protein
MARRQNITRSYLDFRNPNRSDQVDLPPIISAAKREAERLRDQALIEEHIRTKGVTRGRTMYADGIAGTDAEGLIGGAVSG